MSASADIATAHRWARTLEDAEAKRLGLPVREVRNSVARRLGISPGTLENIRRFRTKIVPNWVMARIRSEFVAVLQMEVRRLENEINIARQTGDDPRQDLLAKAEAQLHEAKTLLSGGAQ